MFPEGIDVAGLLLADGGEIGVRPGDSVGAVEGGPVALGLVRWV